jgi:hypothetical protein
MAAFDIDTHDGTFSFDNDLQYLSDSPRHRHERRAYDEYLTESSCDEGSMESQGVEDFSSLELAQRMRHKRRSSISEGQNIKEAGTEQQWRPVGSQGGRRLSGGGGHFLKIKSGS